MTPVGSGGPQRRSLVVLHGACFELNDGHSQVAFWYCASPFLSHPPQSSLSISVATLRAYARALGCVNEQGTKWMRTKTTTRDVVLADRASPSGKRWSSLAARLDLTFSPFTLLSFCRALVDLGYI